MEKNNYAVPVSIVIAGFLIALAIFYGGGQDNLTSGLKKAEPITNLPAISSTDNIKGNPDAKLKIVEYSDLECPFCKVFHVAMFNIIDNHDIAWVYRHYPIDSLHQNARAEAEASACVGKIAGTEKFWQYIDLIFANTKSNDGLDLEKLPEFAVQIGISEDEFNTCLENGDGKAIVEADEAGANIIGVSGTPFPIIIDTDGKAYAIFEENFDLSQVSDEAQAFIEDLYAEYQKVINQ